MISVLDFSVYIEVFTNVLLCVNSISHTQQELLTNVSTLGGLCLTTPKTRLLAVELLWFVVVCLISLNPRHGCSPNFSRPRRPKMQAILEQEDIIALVADGESDDE